jgi:hypothetical protein
MSQTDGNTSLIVFRCQEALGLDFGLAQIATIV